MAVDSERLVARTSAGVIALGVGLVVVAGAGVAAASPGDGGGSSSSSSSSSSERSRGGGSDSSDRSSSDRQRSRESSSSSSRDTNGGTRSGGSRDTDSGSVRPGRGSGSSAGDADSRPSNSDSADRRSSLTRRSATTPVSAPATRTGAAEPSASRAQQAAPEPSRPTAAPSAEPEPQTAPLAAPTAAAAATRISNLPTPTSVVDRRRVQALRTAVTGVAAVPAPAVPGTPAGPVATAAAGALGLMRRDLELQQVYGDPQRNGRYWVGQTSGNCVLMASAMMIGQLTGRTPTERQIVFDAMRTPSVVFEGEKMMYWGLKNDMRWSYYDDARVLLRNHGVESTITYSDNMTAAMAGLVAAVSDPNKAVIVAIEANTVRNPLWYNQEYIPPPPGTKSNHAITVIGVDLETMTVYVNDSAGTDINPETGRPWGQNMAVPMYMFVAAWQTSNYLLMTGSLSGEPLPQRAWNNITPRRDSADPVRDAHLLHFRNT